MGEKRYMISDASKMLNVESHVLRYWEEELNITIPRNEMGHRYYTDFHINLLRNVRDLKKQGYGLRAIKMMIADPKEKNDETQIRVPEITVESMQPVESKDTKMEQFQEIMTRIVSNALKESTSEFKKDLSEDVSQNVLKGVNYIMRVKEEKEEERFKKLDEALRSKQKISKKEMRKKLKAEKLLLKKEKKKTPIGAKKPQTV